MDETYKLNYDALLDYVNGEGKTIVDSDDIILTYGPAILKELSKEKNSLEIDPVRFTEAFHWLYPLIDYYIEESKDNLGKRLDRTQHFVKLFFYLCPTQWFCKENNDKN